MFAALAHHVLVPVAVICAVVVGCRWPIVDQVVGEVERLQLVIAEVCVAVACLHSDTFTLLRVVVCSSCLVGLEVATVLAHIVHVGLLPSR